MTRAMFVLPTIRIKYCTECKWYTNHSQLKSGDWICSCATIHTPEIENGVSTPEWFENIKPIEIK